MIRLRFSVDDVSRIRFGFAPVREAVLGVRALATPGRGAALHTPWVRRVAPALRTVDMELLGTLVRPAGYIPDFLIPVTRARTESLDAGLARIAATELTLVTEQLEHLAGHTLAQRGPGRAARVARLRRLAADPAVALGRIVAALRHYWTVALAPDWPRVRALLQADLSYRLEQLAEGGVRQLFRTLHPLVTLRGDTLEIVKYYDGLAHLDRRGLLLVPCVFAWPDVVVRTADPQPTVTYPPRGLGRLWESVASPAPRANALGDLIGRSRARVLAQLDLPMTTTQLACLLDLSAPTLNVHLKTLRAAGVVSARRHGRAVLYARTDLGERLLGED
ncbi:DUF5937 family protein [Plantactinospora mayteni]|uniref:Transcriptional regulator n=1 Tax=Plantactinospora mayteni TaxID=566021 RepID=A0ABQ4ERA9_9ACTN|nr:DUF5937 family protein [Plantactinospora mayteni]GIG97198.1 transcriptional regulator [Plantactinospora mayteni]